MRISDWSSDVCSSDLDDVVVVDTADALLVAHRDTVHEVKDIVATLKQAQRPEAGIHRKVYRPWGSYDAVDSGARFQVKRISVKPGAALSLQLHHHRRSEEHTSELQSLMRISYAVFCLKKKKKIH